MVAATAATLVLVVLVPGCKGDSDRDQIAAAKVSLEKKDDKAAIIQLKSALQKNPQSGEARFLLGGALLMTGDAAAAAVELEKARDAKFSDDMVLPSLAKAMLAAGQAKKLTDMLSHVSLVDPKAAASLKASTAAAFISQGNVARGGSEIDAALQFDPKNVNARLLKSRLTAGRGAFDDAITLVEGIITDDPKDADAWNLKGELLWLGKSDLDGGATAFRQALSIEPRYVPAHSSLAKLFLQKRDFEGFKGQVASLKKVLPDHPETRFYEVQLALVDQDFKKAREGAQQLLGFAPDNAYVLQLAGAVEFKSGALVAAETHLSKALAQVPTLSLARRLLAETYLRSGQPTKALAALHALLSTPNPGPEALSLAAEAHLQAGDLAKSEHYYTLAAKADPGDTKVRTALALSQVAKGNADAGFAQLELLAANDPSTYADLALISTRMRRRDSDAALKAVERLQTKLPGKPLPELLRGQILAGRGDLVGARASYEKAHAADPAYVPAVAALAAVDLVDKKPADALKRYEALLVRDPKNFQAMLAVAELRQRMGAKPEDIGALLADAVNSNLGEPMPRLARIDHLLSQRQVKAALSAAQDAVSALPGNPLLLDALGRTQLASGDTQQAVSTFRKVAVAQPSLPQPHLRLADAYIGSKDYPSAAQSLRKALEISPKLLVAQRSLIQIALAGKRVDEALKIARAIQIERPGEPVGYVTEGEIHMTQRAWEPAAGAFRSALERSKTAELAMRLHALYVIADRPADAERFAVSWLKDRPRDAGFLFHLGSMAMDRKDFAGAEGRYREVLALLPDNAASSNNIAWLMLKQGKSGALPFAERANQLLPDQPSILDTVALVHAAEKQWSKAIEWQKKAIEKGPDVPGYRMNLAKLLIESGDKAAAKVELQKLEALGTKFASQAEVSSLIKGL